MHIMHQTHRWAYKTYAFGREKYGNADFSSFDTFCTIFQYPIGVNLKKEKGSDIMLEYDEYKVQLNGLAENIKELRDSL